MQRNASKIIHATGRAIERLRWPAKGYVEYLRPVGETACGQKAKGNAWFRAEDAKALLLGKKISKIKKSNENDFVEQLRRYVLPTCQKCAVLVDAALSAPPFVIHFKDLPCGEKPAEDVPLLQTVRRPPFLPTCPVCRKYVLKILGREHDDALLELF